MQRPASREWSHEYRFREAVSADIAEHLTRSAEWASGLLDKLTSDSGDRTMPPGVLNACEGLAFFDCAKGGLGLTWASAQGFIIRKLDHDAYGHSLWSAPVFIKASQVGFGVAAGYERVESALALMNLTTVARFTDKHTIGGADLGMFSTAGAICGVPAGTYGSSHQLEITADNQTTSFCYSVASGVLVNLSINGTQTYPDKHWNEHIYGDNGPAHLDSVLEGKVDTFKEFMPLYRKIRDLATKAIK